MSISEKVWDALSGAIKLSDRIEGLGRQVSQLAAEVRDSARDVQTIDRRLVRLETLLDVALAAKGALGTARTALPHKRGAKASQ